MARETYEADCEVVRLTDEAALLNIDGDEHWVPKSCLENADDLEVGEEATAVIHEWFAIKAGMV